MSRSYVERLYLWCVAALAACADQPGAEPVVVDLDEAIAFSPAYSAYDGEHPFRVPVTVRGHTGVEWDTDRDDLVGLVPIDDHTVMLETRGAGTAKIIATTVDGSGSTDLIITRFEPEERQRGEALYAEQAMPPMIDPRWGIELPSDLSCRGCHGGPEGLTVERTPQQAGGYSDGVLTAMLGRGEQPASTNSDVGLPTMVYSLLHTLPDPSEANVRALIVYLRSLDPVSVDGLDFKRM